MYALIPAEIFSNAFELACCFATAVTAVVSCLFAMRV
jgi:hypothetical protein